MQEPRATATMAALSPKCMVTFTLPLVSVEDLLHSLLSPLHRRQKFQVIG